MRLRDTKKVSNENGKLEKNQQNLHFKFEYERDLRFHRGHVSVSARK